MFGESRELRKHVSRWCWAVCLFWRAVDDQFWKVKRKFSYLNDMRKKHCGISIISFNDSVSTKFIMARKLYGWSAKAKSAFHNARIRHNYTIELTYQQRGSSSLLQLPFWLENFIMKICYSRKIYVTKMYRSLPHYYYGYLPEKMLWIFFSRIQKSHSWYSGFPMIELSQYLVDDSKELLCHMYRGTIVFILRCMDESARKRFRKKQHRTKKSFSNVFQTECFVFCMNCSSRWTLQTFMS